MIDAAELLATARVLIAGEPTQAHLRRAVSTAYYAFFHRILQEGADRLVGSDSASRASRAWLLTYRAFNHGVMADRCAQIGRSTALAEPDRFPEPLVLLATEFRVLQNERHRADYDPLVRFDPFGASQRIGAAADAVARMNALSPEDARLFVTFLLFGARRQGG